MKAPRTFLTLMCFAVLSAASNTASADAVQWRVEDGGNGHFYEGISVQTITWSTARAFASALGGHLVTLTSDAENTWVFDNVASNPILWAPNSGTRLTGPYIGLFQDTTSPNYSEPGGGWTWVTGEPLAYNNWYPGEPNQGSSSGPENWALYWSIGSNPPVPMKWWNDVPSGSARGFIVEYSIPEPTSGVLGGLLLAAYLSSQRRQSRIKT